MEPRFLVEEFTDGKWLPSGSFGLLAEAEAHAKHLSKHRIRGVLGVDKVEDVSPPSPPSPPSPALIEIVGKYIRKHFYPCAHGVRGPFAEAHCPKCADERRAEEEQARRAAEAAAEAARCAAEADQRRREIAASAKRLRSEEALRLNQAIIPSIAELRRLSPQQFEDTIARMFERLGYAVRQTPYSNDHGRDAILMKDGEKFLLECKKYAEDGLSGRPDLQKFHSAIISDKAKRGFFVTSGRFTSGAMEFAATVPIDLIDAQELLRLMFKSLNGASQDDSYSSMCLECGDVVKHHIRSPTIAMCRNDHEVRATLSIDDLLGTYSGSQRCPRCGAPMRLINGKRGKFWGCTKYPECRQTRPFRSNNLQSAVHNLENAYLIGDPALKKKIIEMETKNINQSSSKKDGPTNDDAAPKKNQAEATAIAKQKIQQNPSLKNEVIKWMQDHGYSIEGL